MALFLLCANLGWIQGQFNFTELSLRYRDSAEMGAIPFDPDVWTRGKDVRKELGEEVSVKTLCTGVCLCTGCAHCSRNVAGKASAIPVQRTRSGHGFPEEGEETRKAEERGARPVIIQYRCIYRAQHYGY
jgi:hypothetical protein